jgi:hypothetical protein
MPASPFKRPHATEWTQERLSRLSAAEIKQLRENAERLNETAIVELCSEALAGKKSERSGARKGASPRGRTRTKARHLVARTKAFEARGVYLTDVRTSWGGVRKADGAVVLALWATSVLSDDGSCRYLLWAPNTSWAESAAGKERLEHCKRAMELGSAEGLLVYGEALKDTLPEEKAHAVHGADAEVVLGFKVERVGAEYWAVWGKRAAAE